MNIIIEPFNAILEKPLKYNIKKINNKYKIEVPNIFMTFPITQEFAHIWSFDIICEYKGHQNKYELWFESLDYDFCKKTNKFIPNQECYVFTPHHYITQDNNKIKWYSESCNSDINNKYSIELYNKPYCIYSNKENIWTLCISFIIDDIKEFYEIWRVQDFNDLNEEDIIYTKITNKPEESFIKTQKKANEYIDYIEIYNNKEIAPYLDKLYIIKNGDNIKTYENDEYYDMKYLFNRKKQQNILKKQINIQRIIIFIYICIYIFFAWLIFLYN